MEYALILFRLIILITDEISRAYGWWHGLIRRRWYWRKSGVVGGDTGWRGRGGGGRTGLRCGMEMLRSTPSRWLHFYHAKNGGTREPLNFGRYASQLLLNKRRGRIKLRTVQYNISLMHGAIPNHNSSRPINSGLALAQLRRRPTLATLNLPLAPCLPTRERRGEFPTAVGGEGPFFGTCHNPRGHMQVKNRFRK
jgi:hypothetical protein